jgi:hypothetical protein
MRPKRRRTRKRIGIRLCALAWLTAALWAGGSSQSSGSFAVVAGTVFREPGFALPRAEVILTPQALPEGGKKLKPLKMLTDGRGEFAFRVPAGKAKYRVSVQATGYQPAEKEVLVNADERTDVYLELKAAPK